VPVLPRRSAGPRPDPPLGLVGPPDPDQAQLCFWIYEQNNSGGVWQLDPARGLAPIVYVQAPTPAAADQRLQEAGAYFDGVNRGRDCACCGDRWFPLDGVAQAAWTPTPRLFGFDPEGRFQRDRQFLRRCTTQYLRLQQLVGDPRCPLAAVLRPEGQVQLFAPPKFRFVEPAAAG